MLRLPFSSPFLLYVIYLFMFSIYIRIRCAHSDQWLQRPLGWQISSLNLVSGCVYPLSTGHCPLWVYINSLHQSHQKYTHHSLPPQQSAPPQSCPPQDTGATIYSFSGSNFIHLSLSHIQCRGQTTLAPSPKSTLSAHMLWRSVIRPCDLMDWDVFLVRILEWADTSSSRGAWQPRDRTHVSWVPALQASSLLPSHRVTGEASQKSILNLTVSPHFSSPTLDQALIRLSPLPLIHFPASTLAP